MDLITCPRCSSPAEPVTVGQEMPCFICDAPLYVYSFPRLFDPQQPGQEATIATSGDEATCFFHQVNRAHAPCDDCGRYLCEVCEIHIDGRCLCSECLETRGSATADNRLVNERVLWDSVVLSLAVLPLAFCYFSLIGAPVALAFGIRHFKTPGSLVRGRARMITGITIASLSILAWGAFFTSLLWSLVKG